MSTGKEQDPQSELEQYSRGYTGRGSDGRGRPFHIYQGSVVDTEGGTEADVKARIGQAGLACLQLKNISKSNVISLKKKQDQVPKKDPWYLVT